jgi:ACR3 family arsenite efflux pump ArsB
MRTVVLPPAKAIFYLPSRNLAFTIPLAMALGFVTGLLVNTGELVNYILPVTIAMIYPTMVGFSIREVANISHARLFIVALAINFVCVPLLAFFLGAILLAPKPELFAGLAIASLFPTSNMTIAWTMLGKGNVPAAVNLTVISLILGALLAPWYLLVMVGQSVPLNVGSVFQTVILVILVPLILGVVTYSLLLKRYTRQEFVKEIKPYLAAVTPWGMVFITFVSMSVNARRVISNPDVLILALGVQILFYLMNYAISVGLGRHLFARNEALVLVFTTVLRNLSLALGLAAMVFGSDAALMVAMAFIFQGQSAAWFLKLEEKWPILVRRVTEVVPKLS